MNEDDLRDRLSRIDPAPDEMDVEAPTTASARARLERIMSTHIEPSVAPVDPEASRTSRSPWFVGAAAAAVVVIAGLLAVTMGEDDDAPDVSTEPALELSLGSADAMASCIAVDATTLATMPMAFAATATAVDGELVTLEVDRWYRGGEAEVVQLRSTSGQAALIAGFDFEVGQEYLVSASEGTVSFCGFSGPATPELTALFDEAFPG